MNLTVNLDIADALVLRSELDMRIAALTSLIASLQAARKTQASSTTKTLPQPGEKERELLRRRAVLSKIQKEL